MSSMNSKNWFLLNEKGRVEGPYTYAQVLKRVESKQGSENTFIKAINQEAWGALRDHELFWQKTNRIKAVSILKDELQEKQVRRHMRHNILADAFVEDGDVFLKFRVVNISQGGLGFLANTSKFQVGTELRLFCSPVVAPMSFGCRVRVMSENPQKDGEILYGVAFEHVSEKGKTFLDSLDPVEKAAA